MTGTGKTRPLSGAPSNAELPCCGEEALGQGELDGLCGLYAGINGLRLLFMPERRLKRREVKQLFETGVTFLHGEGMLPSAAVDGFDSGLWHQLLAHLLAEAAAITGWQVQMAQPFATARRSSLAKVLAAVEMAIAAGQPVLVELSNTYHHFTVIDGYSPRRLSLFDSGALHWLNRKSCTTAKTGDGERHHIDPRSLTVLALC